MLTVKRDVNRSHDLRQWNKTFFYSYGGHDAIVNAYAVMPHRPRGHRHAPQENKEEELHADLELLIASQLVIQAQLGEVSNLDSLCAQENATFGSA
jgi:hypothetical protein